MVVNKIQTGDIALIPVSSGYLVSKVLFQSTYFKDIILLALYKIVNNNDENEVLPLQGKMHSRYYTSKAMISKGRWKKIGHEELWDDEIGLSKRIVAGSLWNEDVELNTATEDDMKQYPKMLVMGAKLIEKKAEKVASEIV